jgi:G3E family GTPase
MNYREPLEQPNVEAARTANLIAEVYREQSLARSRRVTEEALYALKVALDDQRRKTADASAEVERIRQEYKITAFSSRVGSESAVNKRQVHFGEVPIVEVFDLRGFNLNAKLDIDPEFLDAGDHHDHEHHDHHDHEHDEHCDHPHHHKHDDDVKSFVFHADRPLNPAKLEDFLGAIVQVYGPKMLCYKGVLHLQGSERKVIFQGVHQLMGSDLGPKWAPGEKKTSKMVFIGIDLPKDILLQGLEQCVS